MNKGFECLSLAARWVFAGLTVSLAACQPYVEVPQPAPEKLSVERILVLPFQDLSAVYGPAQSVRCPICGHAFITGEVASGAGEILTEQLMSLLDAREDLTPIPPGQAQGVLAGYLERNLGNDTEREIPLEVGVQLGADAVMIGHVYQFEARRGGPYSVRNPAAVTFGLNLVRVPDGKLLWSGAYQEVQQSLTENLYRIGTFFRRGGKWLTAEALALDGLTQVLDTLPEVIPNK